MARRAWARRGSARPRSRPGGAMSARPSTPSNERSASISISSTKRAITSERPERRVRVSSPTWPTSRFKRGTPRTCRTAGSSETSRAASVEPNSKKPPSTRRSGGAIGVAMAQGLVQRQAGTGTTIQVRSLGGDLLRIQIHGRGVRLQAGHHETRRGRQQHEVALPQLDGRLALHGEAAAALQHRAEAGGAEGAVAHRPAPGADDAARSTRCAAAAGR